MKSRRVGYSLVKPCAGYGPVGGVQPPAEINLQLLTIFAFNLPPTYIPFQTFDLERSHADPETSKHSAWQHPYALFRVQTERWRTGL